MTEEYNDTHKKQEQYQNKFDPVGFILALVLVGVLVILAINFMTPTIGNVFCQFDRCGMCSCPSCIKELTAPKGELVVIIPKTLYVGIPNRMIAFAYSPTEYSKEEIDKRVQQYLRQLNLSEDEANIERLDVGMGIEGYPRIPTYFNRCYCEYGGYIDGKSKYIDPDRLTVWNLAFTPRSNEEIISVSNEGGCSPPSPDTIKIEFAYPNPDFRGGYGGWCNVENYCATLSGGMVEAPVQIRYFSWTWTLLFLLLLLILVLYLVVKGVQKIRNNKNRTD